MAQIIFLGTAGTSSAISKQLRASGGIVLIVENMQFHLDPGPGALNKCREYGVNPHHTTAVLVSHNHVGHCNDLNAVIDAMTHGGIEHRGIVLGAKSVLHSSEKGHPFLTRQHQNFVERIMPLEKNHKVGLGLVEINALSAEHTDPSAVGFRFHTPKFTLSYTGDTILTPTLMEELQGSDILILNVPYPGEKAKGMNLTSADAQKIISTIRPRLAILTHFGTEMLKADPLQEARNIQQATGVQTIAAKDGLMVSPQGYGRYRSPVKGYD